MSLSLDRALIEAVSQVKFGISESFIEKDWFVTQIIKLLTENQYLDYAIVFTGGTSLSKAHKLIERFSEDIDFRVVAPSLEGQSLSQIASNLSGFKNHIRGLLEQEFEILSVEARNKNRHITLYLAYPTAYSPAEALRPHIKLEFTLSSLALSSIALPVASFVSEASSETPEVETIACIDPVEIAADKLSAILWRIPSRVRGTDDKDPDVVRHLHDLAMLSSKALEYEGFAALVSQTIERDADRAKSLDGLTPEKKMDEMMRILETDNQYPQEYASFVDGMVYNQDASIPSFEEAVSKVRSMIEKIRA